MAHRDDQTQDRLLFTLSLPPDPSCVAAVRRRLREALEGTGRDDLVYDACLVTSELVTNALLHAGSDITVAASYDEHRLLVQVTDDSRHVPRPRRYGEQARTGRGLHLVESMSDDWGFVRHATGKTVWVRWSEPGSPDREPSEPGDWGDDQPTADEDVLPVTLLQFPLLLHAAWHEHIQALLRDYLLASLGSDDDEVAAVMAHAEATDAIAVLDEHVGRWDLGPTTVLATSVEPEVTTDRLVLPVPRRTVPHFAALDLAVEEALELARQGRLLTPPTLPEIRAFRRWLCAQVRQQAAGLAPEPFRVSVDDTLGLPPPDGWDEADVSRAATGRIAADTRSRILALSRPAATLLGYDDPSELVGSRLVSIIPRRLRQAHVAGMTMYVLTDRRPLLGHSVTVPALCRDGSEVLVDLEVNEHPTDDDRPLLIAEIAAHPVGG